MKYVMCDIQYEENILCFYSIYNILLSIYPTEYLANYYLANCLVSFLFIYYQYYFCEQCLHALLLWF